MSSSTLTRAALKVSRPFLKICKWFSMKISSNHKHSGSNGNVCSSYISKEAKKSLQERASDWKWRRVLGLLWLVAVLFLFIWVLTSLNDGILSKKVETPLIIEDNTQESSENCNASMEKVYCVFSSFSVEIYLFIVNFEF